MAKLADGWPRFGLVRFRSHVEPLTLSADEVRLVAEVLKLHPGRASRIGLKLEAMVKAPPSGMEPMAD